MMTFIACAGHDGIFAVCLGVAIGVGIMAYAWSNRLSFNKNSS